MFNKDQERYWDGDLQLYLCLTQLCNWRCDYCDFPVMKNRRSVTIKDLRTQLPMIKEATKDLNIEFSIEGGELGMMDQDTLDFFFENGPSETYFLATNGLFFKQGYYERYKEKIHTVLYHVRKEINDGFSFMDHNTECIIWHTIVVHKKNLGLLPEFLDSHIDNIWFPHVIQPRTSNLDLMDYDYYKKIYEIVKDRPNVHRFFKERYKLIVENMQTKDWLDIKIKLCCNDYTKLIINMPSYKIHRCCISMDTDHIEFTKDNLYNTIHSIPSFSAWDNVCKDCIANFVFHDFKEPNRFSKIIKNIAKGSNK